MQDSSKGTIPLHSSPIKGACFEQVIELLSGSLSGNKLAGDGPRARELERRIQDLFEAEFCFLTSSCTRALELAFSSLGLEAGAEVILPSFTFVSTANALVLAGLKPVFADVDPATLTIGPREIEAKLSSRTAAIVVVHYAGVACAMDEILALASQAGLAVIEDAAHAVGARYKGRHLGTIGDAGCYSFHETKNLTCGEGGAFLTNDSRLAERAQLIRHKGTDRVRFMRGEVDRYDWQAAGSNYLLAEALACILIPQFERLDLITNARLQIFRRYQESFAGLETAGKLRLPKIPDYAEANGHIYHLLFASREERDRCRAALRERSIEASSHYVPLHRSPYYLSAYSGESCAESLPVTEAVCDCLLRLPLHTNLDDRQVEFVIETVKEAAG